MEAAIRVLTKNISLMKFYIKERQGSGFHDVERMVEATVKKIFEILEVGSTIENTNLLVTNFPAIDLVDSSGSFAVQVTTNATTAKIKKTIQAFEKIRTNNSSLKDEYKRLYILGFCKAMTKAEVPDYCEVINTSYIIQKLYDTDRSKVEEVNQVICEHNEYKNLEPQNDKDCLGVILSYLDRSAIKHHMSREGNLDDMTKAFRELSELISTGSILGRHVSKPLYSFKCSEIQEFLKDIRNKLSDITGIVNKNNNSNGFVNLNQGDMQKIDDLKAHISTVILNLKNYV